jgi:glycosyltransferase involved in cell wall biosynthesis
LINATYNNLEIVVVNDGSTDNTDFLVRDFIDHEFKTISTSKTITYIHKSNGGKGSALNAGIKNSNGDIIVTMDADTIFENDAIFNAVKYFYKTDLDAAVGNVKIANSRSLIGIIQQIEYTVGFYFKRTRSIGLAGCCPKKFAFRVCASGVYCFVGACFAKGGFSNSANYFSKPAASAF